MYQYEFSHMLLSHSHSLSLSHTHTHIQTHTHTPFAYDYTVCFCLSNFGPFSTESPIPPFFFLSSFFVIVYRPHDALCQKGSKGRRPAPMPIFPCRWKQKLNGTVAISRLPLLAQMQIRICVFESLSAATTDRCRRTPKNIFASRIRVLPSSAISRPTCPILGNWRIENRNTIARFS